MGYKTTKHYYEVRGHEKDPKGPVCDSVYLTTDSLIVGETCTKALNGTLKEQEFKLYRVSEHLDIQSSEVQKINPD